ncbi:MAG: DUF4097 family beta strand repeat-containing protein [Myxococcota bacterium]|nr:DUF4097 family beta strand repeat-containing protein [Myxococcota bacterium]
MKTKKTNCAIFAGLLMLLIFPRESLGGRFERTIKADGISHLEIQTSSAVSVTAWAKNQIGIQCQKGTIHVVSNAGTVRLADMKNDCNGLAVSVPKSIKTSITAVNGDISVIGLGARLRVTSVSGDVTVKNVTGSVAVEAVSGTLDIRNVRGDLTCKAVSGAVRITDFQAPRLVVKSVSGDVVAKSIKSDTVRLTTHSGDIIYAASPVPTQELSAKSFSGEIQIELPAAAGFDLSASTKSGDIETEQKILSTAASSNRLTGRYGKGGPDVNLATFSGDVEMKIAK